MFKFKKQVDKTIIFIHIPKCAGVTFQTILYNNFDDKKILKIGDAKNKLSYDLFESKYLNKPSKLNYELITGHIQYGLDKNLVQPSINISFLREPTNRYISQYHDILRKGGGAHSHILRNKLIGKTEIENIRNSNLNEFAASKYGIAFGNVQTRFLSNVSPNEPVNREDLELAKLRLKENIVFGLTEYFDESLLLFKSKIGLNNLKYEHKNKTKNKLQQNIIDSETMQLIKQNNKYDIELYKFAHDLFLTRLNELKNVK